LKLHRSILAAALGLVSVLALHAANYEFDHSDGNRLFSGVDNWTHINGTPKGSFPVNLSIPEVVFVSCPTIKQSK